MRLQHWVRSGRLAKEGYFSKECVLPIRVPQVKFVVMAVKFQYLCSALQYCGDEGLPLSSASLTPVIALTSSAACSVPFSVCIVHCVL